MKADFNSLPRERSGKTGWPWIAEPRPLPPLMPDCQPWPKISIVTPSYNQGQFIEETIRSILFQGYPNLEYIIIDGGSTDNTLEIIRKYEPWLTYWISEPDKGQSEAINKGLQKCTGEIFNWICSDDYLDNHVLIKIANNFKDENINAVCGVSRLLYCDHSIGYERTLLDDSIEKMISTSFISQPCTFYRMEVIQRLGGLNNELHYCMDAEWWVRYLLLYGTEGICKTDDILANYRHHASSKTESQPEVFGGDLNAIKYAILKLFRAPVFVSRYYLEGKSADIEILDNVQFVHGSIDRKKLLPFYTRRSIKESFLKGKVIDTVLIVLYDIYLTHFGFFRHVKYSFEKAFKMHQ